LGEIAHLIFAKYFINFLGQYYKNYQRANFGRIQHADKLLIDDQRGLNVTKINNIKTIGSLGVLLLAKQRGLIDNIAPLLSKLDNSDIYLSKQLITNVLELANETPDL
jgi:hypothetical protein